MASAVTRAVRQDYIRKILAEQAVSNQSELVELLANSGIEVTQGTLSRDLEEMGVRKNRRGVDSPYVLPTAHADSLGQAGTQDLHAPSGKLMRVLKELLVDASASETLVVLKTPPGAAQYVASVLDTLAEEYILGCIAGDDTIFAVPQNALSTYDVAQKFTEIIKSG